MTITTATGTSLKKYSLIEIVPPLSIFIGTNMLFWYRVRNNNNTTNDGTANRTIVSTTTSNDTNDGARRNVLKNRNSSTQTPNDDNNNNNHNNNNNNSNNDDGYSDTKNLTKNSKNNSNNNIISEILSTTATTKEDVYTKRKLYFSNSVSISYENTDPLMIMKGRGSKLYDNNGIEYLDTRNNVAHCGHCHPIIVETIQEQITTLNTNTRYLHPNISNLAEQLVALFPSPLCKVFFVNSGSEANDLALRLATAYTKNYCTNTIVVDGAYHGHTISTIEISPYKYERHSNGNDNNDNRTTERLLYQQNHATIPFQSPGDHIWKVPCPDIYRGIHRNPTTAASDYAAYVKEACNYYRTKAETGTIATNNATTRPTAAVRAFIIEGGMSVAGVIIPPVGYIKECVHAVRAAGGLYIADEVQTGFGRFGSYMWAFQASQQQQHQTTGTSDKDDTNSIVPDIVTVGKPFGNGMSLGAVITTQEVVNAFEEYNVEYFNTFGGNPVSAAAGLAMLHVLRNEELQQNAAMVGNYSKTKLVQLQETLINNNSNNKQQSSFSQNCCYIGDIRGLGLFIGIDYVKDLTTREPATLETSYICSILKSKYHILTSIDGPYNNVMVLKPPLVFSMDDVHYFVSSLQQVLEYDIYQTPPLPLSTGTGHTPT